MISRLSAFRISLVLLGVALAGTVYLGRRTSFAVTEMRLDGVPLRIGTMAGTEMRFDDSVYRVLNADGNILRNYQWPDGQVINLYIGYYGTAKGGRASHVPQYCYTGQGWSIGKWDKAAIGLVGGETIEVNRMIVKKRGERQLVYFWFQSDTAVMRTGWGLNWHKLKQRLVHNRNDGALVIWNRNCLN